MQNRVSSGGAAQSAYLFQDSPLVQLAGAQQPLRVLIPAQATGGLLALAEIEEIAPGSGLPRIHREQDEVFFILAGELEFNLNGETRRVGAGDTVYTPREVPRCFRVIGQSAARLVVLSISSKVTAFDMPTAENGDGECSCAPDVLLPCNLHAEQHPATSLCDPTTCVPTPTIHGATALVVRRGEGEIVSAFSDSIRVIVPYAATANMFALGEIIAPPGGGPPLHVHSNEDEFYWIQEGLWQFQIGDEKFVAKSGDRIWAPRNVPHTFRIVSQGQGHALAGETPGDFEQFFRHVAVLLNGGNASPEQITALAGSFGIRFL